MNGVFAMNQAMGLESMLRALTERHGRQAPVHDQAYGLSGSAPRKRCRAIAVAGGKGGVGKTTVSVNLGMALATVQVAQPGIYIAMNGTVFDAAKVRKDRAANAFVPL